MEYSKKAKTLMETLVVILIIIILSFILIPTAYGVYNIFVRVTANQYEEYYKNDPEGKWKKQSDGIMYNKGWTK